MDLSKLSIGDKLAAVGSIVLIISAFFNWYGVPEVDVFGYRVGGLGSWSLLDRGGIAYLIMLAAIAILALILLRMFEVFDISEQGVQESLVVLIAAAIGGLLTLYAVIDTDGASRKLGMWIGIVGAVLMVVGAVMKFQEER